MIPESLHGLLQNPSEDSIAALLGDDSAVFLVDWREYDDAIVECCETVLGTGSLSAESVDIEADPGFELYISYMGKRIKAPLVVGPEDRHITLHTLNRAIAPDFEVRVCIDSNGSDTLAFLPMSSADWATVESEYGQRVAAHFRKIEEKPNLFTDLW